MLQNNHLMYNNINISTHLFTVTFSNAQNNQNGCLSIIAVSVRWSFDIVWVFVCFSFGDFNCHCEHFWDKMCLHSTYFVFFFLKILEIQHRQRTNKQRKLIKCRCLLLRLTLIHGIQHKIRLTLTKWLHWVNFISLNQLKLVYKFILFLYEKKWWNIIFEQTICVNQMLSETMWRVW